MIMNTASFIFFFAVVIGSNLYLGLGRQVAYAPFASFIAFALGSSAAVALAFRFTDQWKQWRHGMWLIIVAGIAVRCAYWGYPLSDDVNRYAWEGMVMSEGINPYVTAPAVVAESYEDDPVFLGINHKEISTAYPPASMFVFKGLSALSYSLQTFKIFAVVCDCLTLLAVALLIRITSRPYQFLALYAFNPLVLIYISGEGHIDCLNLLCIAAALVLLNLKRQNALSMAAFMVCIGCAVMTKYLAVIFIPFMLNRRSIRFLPFVLIPALLFIPLVEPGMFAGLLTFSSTMAYNDVLPKVLRLVLAGPAYSVTMLFIFGGGLGAIWLVCQKNYAQGCLFAYLWCLVCLPSVHSWYLLPVILFSVLYANRMALVFCITIGFGFWVLNYQLIHGEWKEFTWIWCCTYVPVFAVAVIDLVTNRRLWYDCYGTVQSVDLVIPVYNESDHIGIFIDQVEVAIHHLQSKGHPITVSVLFVDGGSSDATVALIENAGYCVIRSSAKGRGNQIAQGVEAGSGELVLILHADAAMHKEALVVLVEKCNASHAHWGILGHKYDSNHIRMRIIEVMNSVRFHVCGLAFGDQGMFVRRDVLERIAVPHIPLMEDVEKSLRLLDRPRLCLGRNLTVSARRWDKYSAISYTWLVLSFVFCYLLRRRLGQDIKDISTGLYKKYYS